MVVGYDESCGPACGCLSAGFEEHGALQTYMSDVKVSVNFMHFARDMASLIFIPKSDLSYFIPILRTL